MPPNYDIIYSDSGEVADQEVAVMSGAIPSDLEGAVLRNGTGSYQIGPDPLHFFDGFGIVAAVGFKAGRARLRARFVKSAMYEEERAAGRQLQRRSFTTVPGRSNLLDLDLGNSAAHNTFHFAGRLYACDDPGYYRLDPRTFDTISEERWGGRVGKKARMAAVPRIDSTRNRLITYQIQPRPVVGALITFYEFDRNWRLVSEVQHPLRGWFGLVHEIAFTANYFVVVEMPRAPSLAAVARGKKAIAHCLESTARQPVIHIVPRNPSSASASGKKAISRDLPGNIEALFHNANAYEEDDCVIFDGVSYPWPDHQNRGPPAYRERHNTRYVTPPTQILRRFRVPLGTGEVSDDELCRYVEGPRINPDFFGRPYRFAYLFGSRGPDGQRIPFVWPHQIVKVDVASKQQWIWDAGECVVSQPVFAPRRGAEASSAAEDDGYVLVLLSNLTSQRAELVILDARAFDKGPLARLELSSFLGPALHCQLAPELDIVAN